MGNPADVADRGCVGRLEGCKPGDGVSPAQPPESSDCPGETDVTPVVTAEALPSFFTLIIILSTKSNYSLFHNSLQQQQLQLYNYQVFISTLSEERFSYNG